MRRNSITTTINASGDRVFTVLHDYSIRLTWDTMLSSADLIGGAQEAALGVKTRCVGNWKCFWIPIEADYVSYQPGKVAAVKMSNRPLFFEKFAATISHTNLDHETSNVTYIYNFTAKPKLLAFLLEPIMEWFLNREVRFRLQALKRFIEKNKSMD